MLRNEKAFTLIEMLVVLMIITVLIILIIPNIGEQSEGVHSKGCDALESLVQTQVDAFHIETGSYPDNLEELIEQDYINADQTVCQNGTELEYDASQGRVTNPDSDHDE